MWQLLVVTLTWLPRLRAAFLPECEGVIISYITNPNATCSQFIYCNGDNSFYCNGDCSESVSCYEEELTSTALVPTLQTTTEAGITATVTITPTAPPLILITSTTAPTTLTIPTTLAASTWPSSRVNCRQLGQNGVYPYPGNSNYFYQCISGYLLLQQCPRDSYFDAEQGRCILL